MNLVFGLHCNDLKRIMGYVKVTNVINRTNDKISESAIISQIDESWNNFQHNGGGRVTTFIEYHNEMYATQLEVFRVITLQG